MGDARGPRTGLGAGAGASGAGRRGGIRAPQGGCARSPRTSREAGAGASIARMRAGVVAGAGAGAGAGAPLQAKRAVPGREPTKVFCKRWHLTEMD